MLLGPEAFELLMKMDAPQEQKVALFKALEREWQAYSQPATASGENEERERLRNESTYAERKRAKDRARRAAEREELRRLKAEREATATTPATPREATATEGDDAATTRDPAPRTCAGKSPLSSSLRSEGNPPEKPSVSTPKGAKEPRGTRIPEDWAPDFEAALAVGLGGDDARREADKFRDYWRAVPGAKGRKTDWPATWRNWCRTAADNLARKAPHERPHPDAKQAARQANYARAFAGAERASGRDWKP